MIHDDIKNEGVLFFISVFDALSSGHKGLSKKPVPLIIFYIKRIKALIFYIIFDK